MKHKTSTALLVSASAITAIHTINRVQYSLATVKNKMGCSENNYYEWRFGKIRYTKKGNGSPLLLIHDLKVGSSNYEYHKLVDTLSKDNEVYAIDLLGFGLSDKPNLTYTSFLYVQLIIDFIKNVINKKTNIIASGDSVPIAIMACHNSPETIHKMIFINPQSLYKLNQIPSKQTKALKLLIEFPILGTFAYNIITNRNSIKNAFEEEYFFNPIKISEDDILTYIEAAHISDYRSKFVFSSYVGRYTNTNILHALKEINHSMYIIAGKEKENNDTIIDNYIYYNSSIEASYIEKTRHLSHMEQPEKVLEQIEIFLTS